MHTDTNGLNELSEAVFGCAFIPGGEKADTSCVIPAKAGIHAAPRNPGRCMDACFRRHDSGESVIPAVSITVLNTLGAGFLEKVHENALAHELSKRSLAVTQQRGITVIYDGGR